MAKCVEDISTGQISRHSDEQASRLVNSKMGYKYVPKSLWKAQTREEFPMSTQLRKPKKETEK